MTYLVQIESKGQGDVTSCMVMDLAQVQNYAVIRKGGKPDRVVGGYGEQLGTFEIVGGTAAQSFLDKMDAYRKDAGIEMMAIDPPAVHSDVIVAGPSGDVKQFFGKK